MSCCSSCAGGGPCEGSLKGASSPADVFDMAATFLPFTPLAPLATMFQPRSGGGGGGGMPSPSVGPSPEDEAAFRALEQRWAGLQRSAASLPGVGSAYAASWLPFSAAWRSGEKKAGELATQLAQVEELERARVARMRLPTKHPPHRVLVVGAVGVGLVGAGLVLKAIL